MSGTEPAASAPGDPKPPGRRWRRRAAAGLAAAATLTGAAVAALPGTAVAAGPTHRAGAYLIRTVHGETAAAAADVTAAGGHLVYRLDVLDMLVAKLPVSAVDTLRTDSHVLSVSPDGKVRLFSTATGYDPASDNYSIAALENDIHARDLWRQGVTGRGVDVAVVDSGVDPVGPLAAPGKVIDGPDLSLDAQTPDIAGVDTFGHGSHMASIIAGNDSTGPVSADDTTSYLGVAPDARVLAVKAGGTGGVTDVSAVIAAIGYVVQHAHDPGVNVRVLNLSFGTDSTQSYVLDPLAYAAEVAWRSGIVVVASAGNDGSQLTMSDPATDPYVIAVGAADTQGTASLSDDTVAPFSNRGNSNRKPDLVAPGMHVPGVLAPGSYVDTTYGSTAIGDGLIRGSGTSQAAAVVSGAAALLLQRDPSLSPDQVKAKLAGGATLLTGIPAVAQGAGELNVLAAANYRANGASANQRWRPSSGTGSMEAARGSRHVKVNGQTVSGNTSLVPTSVSSSNASWANASWANASWANASWANASWANASWANASWANASWANASWANATWANATWANATWANASWS